MDDYINGFVQRTSSGQYLGKITIEGISLGKIEAVYFKKDNDSFVWLKRRKVLEYDDETMSYSEREPLPQWEAYMKKQADGGAVAYKGEFCFLRFRFSIVGVWDRVLGADKNCRLNLFVERLPQPQQTIINSINEKLRNG